MKLIIAIILLCAGTVWAGETGTMWESKRILTGTAPEQTETKVEQGIIHTSPLTSGTSDKLKLSDPMSITTGTAVTTASDINLDNVEHVFIHRGGKTITVTSDELWKAVQSIKNSKEEGKK